MKTKSEVLIKSYTLRVSKHTPFKVPDLWSFGSTSVDAGALETRGSAIFSCNLLHLLSQLTGWCQHQALNKYNLIYF